MMKRSFLRTLCAFSLFVGVCLSVSGAVAAERAAQAPADTPVAVSGRSTAVTVDHEGTDNIGAQLSFELKGLFNRSSLFILSEKDEPKIRLLLSTTSEFPSRPGIASAYAAVWTFSQGEGTLSFFLAREVGLVSADEVDALVARLAEKTDGIAVRYSYLMKK